MLLRLLPISIPYPATEILSTIRVKLSQSRMAIPPVPELYLGTRSIPPSKPLNYLLLSDIMAHAESFSSTAEFPATLSPPDGLMT